MERKKKKCKECGRLTYLFSRGRCKSCAAKTYKRIGHSAKYDEVKQQEYEAMRMAWDQAADEKGQVFCAECGKLLPGWDAIHCAHVLSKGSAPQFRCDPRNFIMLCYEHHHQFDHGLRMQMKIWPRALAIINQLKNELRSIGGGYSEDNGQG